MGRDPNTPLIHSVPEDFGSAAHRKYTADLAIDGHGLLETGPLESLAYEYEHPSIGRTQCCLIVHPDPCDLRTAGSHVRALQRTGVEKVLRAVVERQQVPDGQPTDRDRDVAGLGVPGLSRAVCCLGSRCRRNTALCD